MTQATMTAQVYFDGIKALRAYLESADCQITGKNFEFANSELLAMEAIPEVYYAHYKLIGAI